MKDYTKQTEAEMAADQAAFDADPETFIENRVIEMVTAIQDILYKDYWCEVPRLALIQALAIYLSDLATTTDAEGNYQSIDELRFEAVRDLIENTDFIHELKADMLADEAANKSVDVTGKNVVPFKKH